MTSFAGISTDYRRFYSDSMLNCYKLERDAVKAIIPDALVTTNLMGTFKGLDYFKWAKEMDIVSWDNYPAYDTPWSMVAMTHDLMRGLKEEARARGVTRAMVSMEKACRLDGDLIFAVGNAPTALIQLDELIRAGKLLPKLIIGVPVGFVNVVEAKELIMAQEQVPYIVAKGRKGGSNVAAAICNALLYQLYR